MKVMMMPPLLLVLLLLSACVVVVDGQSSCGEFSIAGSIPAVDMIARGWIDGYTSQRCPSGTEINVVDTGTTNIWNDDGSILGAKLVCDKEFTVLDGGESTPVGGVDISGMSRKPLIDNNEAQQAMDSDWKYECLGSPYERNLIEIDIGYEGIGIGVQYDSVAAECLELMGEKLTMQQIRYILWWWSRSGLVE